MSNDQTENTTIPLRAYFAHFFLGALFLFFCLFPPNWLSQAASKLVWNPSNSLPTPTILANPPIAIIAQKTTSECYTWGNLSSSSANQVQALFSGNNLVSNLTTSPTASKIGLAVVMPADSSKRIALAKILSDNKIDTNSSITLSNGNKAWSVGSFATEELAQSFKSSLSSKGAWNIVTEIKPSTTSFQFDTTSSAFILKLNSFAKEQGLSPITACFK